METPTLLKNERRQMFFIAIMTAIAGEFKVVPFSGEAFRFGLGSSVFFLLLLLIPYRSSIRVGFVTGATVFIFRVIKDISIHSTDFSFNLSMHTHLPAALFYLFYGIGFSLIPIAAIESYPFRIGLLASLDEFFSNGLEHVFRLLLSSHVRFQLSEWLFLLIVALVRSYFVVGIYSSISINRISSLHKEHQKRMEQMLNIGSGLYGESFYLEKSMNNMEQITGKSHALYRKLKEAQLTPLSKEALEISQQIHEVKKDSQRILAGLSKLTDQEMDLEMKLSDMISYAIKANEKYSELLHKEVVFWKEIHIDFATSHYVPLLTILNNLVSNAVESIEKQGFIEISVYQEKQYTVMCVKDSGKGIQEEDVNLIFEPGFTTKFNEIGVAATGIGLSHVQDIVRAYDGQVRFDQQAEKTVFTVLIPTIRIQRGG